MTKKELYEELRKHNYRKTYPEVFAAAYNLALDRAAEKATKIIDGGTTEFLIPNEILNLKITE